MNDNDKNAYRTPADEPEPDWKELTSFEVEVSSLGQSDGVKMYGQVKNLTNFEHAVGTHDERAKATLRLGQRVRVILQVLAALALAGCSSSSKNDELFGTGGTYGEASVGGSGGAAGAAGAGTGGVAGAGAAGAPAGGGGAGVDAGPACTVIQVVGSVYANNCGTPTPLNGVAGACDGETDCTYDFAFAVDPGFDPKPGCPKDLTVTYLCVDGLGETRGSKSAYTPPDAATTKLECGCY